MTPVGSSFFSVSDRPLLSRGGPEAGPVVVWLWGEHDQPAPPAPPSRYAWAGAGAEQVKQQNCTTAELRN
jgi:hypothetical protein